MGKYFGTDGIRGLANKELTPDFLFKLGRASAYILKDNKDEKPIIILGKDTRVSGDMIEACLVAGICSTGVDVVSLGVCPTPCIAYITKKYKASAGIMISASHNPFQDNGIKFFASNGFKLNDSLEEKIEKIIDSQMHEIEYAYAEKIGRLIKKEEYLLEYIDFISSTLNFDLDGLNVIIDCANGATYKAAPLLFEKLKVNLKSISTSPNGVNINKECGSTFVAPLCEEVKKSDGAIGIAFDGDGDRCFAVDEDGELVDGDIIMAICANALKEEGKLNNNSIVATIMSNLGLFLMGEEKGLNILKANVGDRYVLEKMLEEGYNFGGEQSGHIIFLDYITTGDGILTAVKLLGIIKKTGKKLSELRKVINILPQVLINVKVENSKKHDYLKDDIIKDAILDVENRLNGKGRILVRVSGTEPLIRVMIEGENQQIIEKYAKEIADLIKERLA